MNCLLQIVNERHVQFWMVWGEQWHKSFKIERKDNCKFRNQNFYLNQICFRFWLGLFLYISKNNCFWTKWKLSDFNLTEIFYSKKVNLLSYIPNRNLYYWRIVLLDYCASVGLKFLNFRLGVLSNVHEFRAFRNVIFAFYTRQMSETCQNYILRLN